MFYNAVIAIFGGALVVGATNISMFLAGRFFAGMSAFGFLVVTPVYTSELSPPHFRGLFCGLNGVFIGLGYSSWSPTPTPMVLLMTAYRPRSMDGRGIPLCQQTCNAVERAPRIGTDLAVANDRCDLIRSRISAMATDPWPR